MNDILTLATGALIAGLVGLIFNVANKWIEDRRRRKNEDEVRYHSIRLTTYSAFLSAIFEVEAKRESDLPLTQSFMATVLVGSKHVRNSASALYAMAGLTVSPHRNPRGLDYMLALRDFVDEAHIELGLAKPDARLREIRPIRPSWWTFHRPDLAQYPD